MRRLRLAAAFLAALTAFVDALMYADQSIHGGVVIAAALAAAILIVITPFEASGPPERKRVVAACGAFVVVIGLALLLAVVTASAIAPIGALTALMLGGVALTIWAYKTRNRRRLSGWHNYYDH